MNAGASTRVFSPPTSTSTALGPMNVAVPFITSTPFPFSSRLMPPFIFLMTPSLNSRSFAMSTFGSPARIPRSAAFRISSTRFAAAMSAFDGMHPQLMHTPPSGFGSTSAAFLPSSPSRMAAT